MSESVSSYATQSMRNYMNALFRLFWLYSYVPFQQNVGLHPHETDVKFVFFFLFFFCFYLLNYLYFSHVLWQVGDWYSRCLPDAHQAGKDSTKSRRSRDSIHWKEPYEFQRKLAFLDNVLKSKKWNGKGCLYFFIFFFLPFFLPFFNSNICIIPSNFGVLFLCLFSSSLLSKYSTSSSSITRWQVCFQFFIFFFFSSSFLMIFFLFFLFLFHRTNRQLKGILKEFNNTILLKNIAQEKHTGIIFEV